MKLKIINKPKLISNNDDAQQNTNLVKSTQQWVWRNITKKHRL